MMFSFASGSHSDKVLSCGRYSSMLSPLGSAYTFFLFNRRNTRTLRKYITGKKEWFLYPNYY